MHGIGSPYISESFMSSNSSSIALSGVYADALKKSPAWTGRGKDSSRLRRGRPRGGGNDCSRANFIMLTALKPTAISFESPPPLLLLLLLRLTVSVLTFERFPLAATATAELVRFTGCGRPLPRGR